MTHPHDKRTPQDGRLAFPEQALRPPIILSGLTFICRQATARVTQKRRLLRHKNTGVILPGHII